MQYNLRFSTWLESPCLSVQSVLHASSLTPSVSDLEYKLSLRSPCVS